MRKSVLVAALALALAAPAVTNAFTPHFSVISKSVEDHRTQGGGFAFKDNFFDPANPSNSIGRDRGRCKPRSHDVIHCRAIAFFNGELGGEGTITVKGNLKRGDARRLNVTGGTGDFNGAAGKAVITTLGAETDRIDFDLVR